MGGEHAVVDVLATAAQAAAGAAAVAAVVFATASPREAGTGGLDHAVAADVITKRNAIVAGADAVVGGAQDVGAIRFAAAGPGGIFVAGEEANGWIVDGVDQAAARGANTSGKNSDTDGDGESHDPWIGALRQPVQNG